MGPWIVPVSGFILFALNEIANPRRAFLGKVLWKGDRRGVGLTFDDGPHPLHTARVLDILEQFQAKATFFVIGRHLREHGALVAAAARAGHVIGNHTDHHFRTMNFFSSQKIREEILECQNEVERWTGYKPRFYRQPTGFRNPRIFGVLKELRISLVGWQVRAFDTQRQDPKVIAKSILRKVQPGGVILLHDGSDSAGNEDRTATLQALTEILQGLKDRGMEFLTLEELLGMSKEVPPAERDKA